LCPALKQPIKNALALNNIESKGLAQAAGEGRSCREPVSLLQGWQGRLGFGSPDSKANENASREQAHHLCGRQGQ